MVNSAADPAAGGAEKHVFDLADGLRARGHEISFLHGFPRRDRRLDPDTTVLSRSDWRHERIGRIPHIVDDWLSFPTSRLEGILTAYRPDVVHTHNLLGISTGIWEVSRRLGVPVVHTLHDYRLLCIRATLVQPDGEPCRPNPLLCGLRTRRITRWARGVSHLIGVSRFVLDAHMALFPAARPHVISHAIVPVGTRPLQPPGASFKRLGYIGLLKEQKGIEILIDAAPRLAERGVTLAIAGKGPLEGKVAGAAATVPGLHYEGFVSGDQKEAFFESCDAGIVPSIWNEPAPYSALEWLCAGRPLLTSPLGGLGELSDRFASAIRVEPTIAGITEGVDQLLDEARWRELVAGAKSIVPEGDVERWVGEYEGVYRAAADLSSG
jgi:glycosyltransferase involved in cell wall biosynthesis